MPLIKILQAFNYAHGGVRVEAFAPGDEPVETTEQCAQTAVESGWAELVQTPAPDTTLVAEAGTVAGAGDATVASPASDEPPPPVRILPGENFAYAHHGYRVQTFEAGIEADTTAECAEYAVANGLAAVVVNVPADDGAAAKAAEEAAAAERAAAEAKAKAKAGAPENRDAASAATRSTKQRA